MRTPAHQLACANNSSSYSGDLHTTLECTCLTSQWTRYLTLPVTLQLYCEGQLQNINSLTLISTHRKTYVTQSNATSSADYQQHTSKTSSHNAIHLQLVNNVGIATVAEPIILHGLKNINYYVPYHHMNEVRMTVNCFVIQKLNRKNQKICATLKLLSKSSVLENCLDKKNV